MEDNEFILVFDSGIGGLTFLKKAVKELPYENFIYYGDNENAPYGNKSKKMILQLVKNIFDSLTKYKIKASVLACNTVTAECAKELRQIYSYKIIGLEPAIKPAYLNGGSTAILCTKATAKSEKFNLLLKNYPDSKILIQKKLAKKIEKNIFNLKSVKFDYLFNQLKCYNNVVLGCTHYIFIKKEIQKNLKATIFDGNDGAALNLKNSIKKVENENKNGQIIFLGKSALKNKTVFENIDNL